MEKHKGKKLLPLFLTFLRIGAFTFGGGYAMIPLVQREVAERKKWITEDDILEILAISESTPGPIAVNMATFVGYRVAGFFGAISATLGVVLPSLCIISVIALVLRQFATYKAVKYAFFGIRAGVLALLIKSLWSMGKKCERDPIAWGIVIGAFVSSAIFDFHVLLIILACALMGLAWTNIAKKKKEGMK